MEKIILLVEDEPGLRKTLSDRIRGEGFRVEVAANGIDGFEKAATGAFDLVVLDVMLPKKNGIDVCRDLRQQGVQTPILMLSAKSQTIDKVVGLKMGADDYLTKPFEAPELMARIEVLLRRPVIRDSSSEIQLGSIRFNTRRAELSRSGKPIPISAREFRLLRYFTEHRGEALTREELLQAVWGYDSAPTTRTVDVHVAWLRQKLEDDPKKPKWILTVHGIGYRFAG
ncbi:MAG TPA: response regulator transcription factor [Bryobacteraceae bacterium]|nr:response regulator transcription factor [Bryobacteraceae bacterium]